MSAAEEYEAAKLEFARVLRFREGEPAKYIAVNRRLDDAVRALMIALASQMGCGPIDDVDRRSIEDAAAELLPRE